MSKDTEYFLHNDVVMDSVTKISDSNLEKMQVDDNDYAIFKKASRSKAKIICEEIYSFLCHFKTPMKIDEAAKIESKKMDVSSEEFLEAVNPIIKTLIRESFLVDSKKNEQKKISTSFQRGDMFRNYYIQRCLWLLEDTEIYEIYNEENRKFILKIGKKQYIKRISKLYDKESFFLKKIGGDISPKIIEYDYHEESPYIIMEWCNGKPIHKILNGLLKENTLESQNKIISIVKKIAKAYTILHDKKVIHGDVNYKNVLYTIDDEIKIIDFGNSYDAEKDYKNLTQRPGFTEFYDPQLVDSKYNKTPIPQASILSDQYSIGAMLYFCITGNHYVDFALERNKMFEQILNVPPRPFSELGFEPWPQLEELLSKAMGKKEEDRFEDMKAFLCEAEKLEPVSKKIEGTYEYNLEKSEEKFRAFLEQANNQSILKEQVMEIPPFSQFNFGMSGIAYGLYRLSKLEESPDLLSLADIWSVLSLKEKDTPNAYYCDVGSIVLPPEQIGLNSLYHTKIGSYLVELLIGIAMNDYPTIDKGVNKIIDSIDYSDTNLDLTLGYSGLLIGLQSALDMSEGTTYADITKELIPVGNKIVDILYKKLSELLPIYKNKEIEFLGIAHGWSGLIYSFMLWQHLDRAKYEPFISEVITQLIEFSSISENGQFWPRKIPKQNRRTEYLTSWCNGSTGFVFFWLEAYKFFKKDIYLHYAKSSGDFSWKNADNNPGLDLCCGLSGKIYSYLALYKIEKEEKWLNRAKMSLDKALEADKDSSYVKPHSLFKGDVGLAVLCKEIEHPLSSVMPLFEREL